MLDGHLLVSTKGIISSDTLFIVVKGAHTENPLPARACQALAGRRLAATGGEWRGDSPKRANQDSWTIASAGKDFSNWIKKQIERARLLENRDYVIFAQKGENTGRGRSSLDYHLAIEAAKLFDAVTDWRKIGIM